MVTIAALVDILKENQLWVASRSVEPKFIITGKPVTDSRLLQPGDAFICIKGFHSDGHKFIRQAREREVSIIIMEDDFQDDLPAIRVCNSRKAAALFAKLYFHNPTSKFKLIGITGTNGKTTTSLLIRQAFLSLGKKAGWIGTLGYIIESELVTTNNTTPDIMELNNIFDMMVEAECEYVIMEVSSHALALDRVFGLEFEIALFTNLSRDHLDFHKDMTDYFEIKYKLFEYTMKKNGISIINIDDEYGKIINKRISAIGRYKKVSVSEKKGDVTIVSGRYDSKGSYVKIKIATQKTLSLSIDLVGHFNVLNAVMAIAVIKETIPNLSDSELEHVAISFKPVRGRLEQIENNRGLGIYVDYAHTPDALKNVLLALSELEHKRVITVLGAGGDRDKGKRPEMLQISLDFSDAVFITDDNPRTENPAQIIKDIIGETATAKPWWIIRDRKKAIESALRLAQKDDLILIAGKGHETYQEINGVRNHFDDKEVAQEYLAKTQETSSDELVLPIDSTLLEVLYKSPFRAQENKGIYFRFISTDSRSTKSGSLFFALKGENFDGMNFVDSILADSSNGAFISKDLPERESVILSSGGQKSLGILAQKYLQMFSLRKIALTGSTGKTTTKELIANVFAETGQILKTHANENNIIGLSKTIFRIKPEDKTAIFELGTNHFGEISALTDICKPDLAIITNIGPSHLEFLIDEKGVYREKTDLFRKGAQTIIYPGDDERFDEFRESGISVGYSEKCTYRIENVNCGENGTTFMLNGQGYKLKQPIPFYVLNAALAITAAVESGISYEVIKDGLQKPLELQSRMEIRKIGDLDVVIDCYNANPVSMQAAIEFWYNFKPGKPHLAILGDMLELGGKSQDYHKRIGESLCKLYNIGLITVGHFSKLFHTDSLAQNSYVQQLAKHYRSVDELLMQPFISSSMGEMVVLIKASHGIQLEKVIPALEKMTSVTTNNKFEGQ
jgi:UDP-N-acetylmuramyl-tripeptide synthetase/UDP-N-acetylmuramoyl-tripeptide--D-alanyl-D-alanine ligase